MTFGRVLMRTRWWEGFLQQVCVKWPDRLRVGKLFRTSRRSQNTPGRFCFLQLRGRPAATGDAIYYLQKQDRNLPNNPLVKNKIVLPWKLDASDEHHRNIFCFVVSTLAKKSNQTVNSTEMNEPEKLPADRKYCSDWSWVSSCHCNDFTKTSCPAPPRARWASSSSKWGFNLRRGKKNKIKLKVGPAGQNHGNCGSFANAAKHTSTLIRVVFLERRSISAFTRSLARNTHRL